MNKGLKYGLVATALVMMMGTSALATRQGMYPDQEDQAANEHQLGDLFAVRPIDGIYGLVVGHVLPGDAVHYYNDHYALNFNNGSFEHYQRVNVNGVIYWCLVGRGM